MLIIGWFSVASQEAISSRTDTHLISFQEDRQKYTAVINITLILSERALQRPVTSLAWVSHSTIGTLTGLSSPSSSSLLIFSSMMRLSHQLQVWHQWLFFFSKKFPNIKAGLLLSTKYVTVRQGHVESHLCNKIRYNQIKKSSYTGLWFDMGVFALIVAKQMLQS